MSQFIKRGQLLTIIRVVHIPWRLNGRVQERPWDTRAAEGTAPPSYKAMIVYDPDIRTDGNPKNDDIYLKDNQLQLPGARINELFRRP